MAIQEAEQQAVTLEDAKVAATKFYKEYESIGYRINKFVADVRALRGKVVELENMRANIANQVREAELNLAKVNEQAKTRLANVDKGQAAIIESITKRELALIEKEKQLARMEDLLKQKDRDLELLKVEFERRLSVLKAPDEKAKNLTAK